MNMIKCPNGHLYHADKLESCPYCSSQAAGVEVEDLQGRKQSQVETLIPDKAISASAAQLIHKTVAGWLVVVHGSMKGDFFPLFAGDNHIGRDSTMDIALYQEPTVSRFDHAILSYPSDGKRITLTPGAETRSHTLLNDTLLHPTQSKVLRAYDRIWLGNCKLVFVPLCGSHFNWEWEDDEA